MEGLLESPPLGIDQDQLLLKVPRKEGLVSTEVCVRSLLTGLHLMWPLAMVLIGRWGTGPGACTRSRTLAFPPSLGNLSETERGYLSLVKQPRGPGHVISHHEHLLPRLSNALIAPLCLSQRCGCAEPRRLCDSALMNSSLQERGQTGGGCA